MSICTNFLNPSHQLSNRLKQLNQVKALPFSKILSEEEIINSTVFGPIRDRVFSLPVVVWAFLSQALEEDKSQQAAVLRVIASLMESGKKIPSANTSAYSQARSRLPEECLSNLSHKIAKEVESTFLTEERWKGRRVKLIDGSTLSIPDTPENQQAYPQSPRQQKGLGFPCIRVVAVVDYITGVVSDIAMKPAYGGKQTGEHALLRELMHLFDTHDVVIGDRYYPSFFLMATLFKHTVSGVFPQHGSRHTDFRRGSSLGRKDHLVQWPKPKKPEWMEQKEYDAFPEKITVREVEVQISKPGFRDKKMILVTTFFDQKEIPPQDLIELYSCRWFVELTFYSIKETMQMGILRGKTPAMVRKEIWAHLLAYNLIRRMMAMAAQLHKCKSSQLSFKLALQALKIFYQLNLYHHPVNLEKLLEIISYKQIANRPNRMEPRAVKRRPKRFPRLQKPREFYKNAA